MLSYLVLPNSISVTLEDGNNYVIHDTHPNFTAVRQALKAKDFSSIEDLISIPKSIAKQSFGKVKVDGEELYFEGKAIHSYLAQRMLELFRQGFDIEPWANFMTKLYQNPSYRAVNELYPFLEKGNLPICPDGDFLAYKYVTKDYKDCHTRTFDNSVGQVVTMPRNQVDEDRDRTCSAGLHFCSKDYLPSYGNGSGYRVVLVKVNPADVVSIPADHNDQKARCWRYEVVGEIDVDYGFEDFAKSPVLPAPRDNKALNSKKAKPKTNLEERIWNSFVNRLETSLTVRTLAKSLNVTNADIVNSLGNKFYLLKDNNVPLSDRIVNMKCKYIPKEWRE